MHEESLFLAALERPTAAARAAFLDGACGGDAGLRARVERLLAADSDGGILDAAPDTAGPAAATLPPPWQLAEGREFAGRFRLVRRLGAGGMGEVWAADQTAPVRRPVALKFVHPGLDPAALLARFDRERQLLAVMDHPNIARVYDAGVAGGVPYLVMELVDGVPVTAYCDARRMTVRERLELFLPVCRAVQHAHQKGVIHRDLKPANVLVADVDGRPAPKVIDFGIARGHGAWSTGDTIPTGLGAVLGTPEYMAPEQATGATDVDTRADVYALGALLYELLTGTPPFRTAGPGAGGLLDLLRAVREDDPPAPSERVASAPDPAAADARSTDQRRLPAALRGDLDRVLLKALEKDRGRRYDAAAGLAQDVERYLAGEPVTARPVGRAERLGRWARRNPAVAGLLAAVALLLLTAGVGATAFAVRLGVALDETRAAKDRTETARRHTREVLDALTDDAVERLLAQQPELTAEDRDFLRRVIALHETLIGPDGDTPDARAEVAGARHRVGLIRHRLGEYAAAEEAFRAARGVQQELADAHRDRPEFRRALARTQTRLCNLLRETGRPRDAEAAGRAAVELLQGLADTHSDQPEYRIELAAAQTHLGVVLLTTGQPRAAEAAHRAAIGHLKDRAVKPADRRTLAGCHVNLGNLLRSEEKMGPAEESYLAARDILQQLSAESADQPEYRRELALLLNNLAPVYALTGRRPEAEMTFRAAADVLQKLADGYPSRPDYGRLLASTQSNLGNLLTRMRRHGPAEEAYRAARDRYERLVADHRQVAEDRSGLAHALAGLALLKCVGKDQDGEAARRLLEQALPHDRAAVQAEGDNPIYRERYSTHQGLLAEVLVGLKDHAGAAAAADVLADIAHDPADEAWTAARVLARCVPWAEGDALLSETEQKELARTYARRAVTQLKSAVRHGFKDAERLRDEPAFRTLKERDDCRDDFGQLLVELDAARR